MKKYAIFILLLMSIECYGQRTVTDKISYMYVMSDSETVRQAEATAIKHAQLQMIADNFGTIIGSTTTLLISNSERNASDVRSHVFGETEVKGEWIKTIGTPLIEYAVVNNHFVIKVSIEGVIREIVSTPIDFHCKILRNGVEDSCESLSFKYGDYMYMLFQTPVNGCLAVYMTDGEIVQSLFPYSGLPASYMNIQSDKKYIFFSKEKSGEIDPNRVQRMQLGCKLDVEQNRIYIVFSPNSFIKAVDRANGNLPRQLSFEEFHSWLAKIRQIDRQMNVRSFDITISR